jgi:hypothetical protein
MHYVVIAKGSPDGWTPPAGDQGTYYWTAMAKAPPDGWTPAMVEQVAQLHAGIEAAEGILPLENGNFRAIKLSIPKKEDAEEIAFHPERLNEQWPANRSNKTTE